MVGCALIRNLYIIKKIKSGIVTRGNLLFLPSNNMLYPKEDKERRILLYAVSSHYVDVIAYQLPA